MEGHFSKGQSPQWALVPVEEEVTRMGLRNGGMWVKLQALPGICLLSISSRPALASTQMAQIAVGISGFKQSFGHLVKY